MGLQVGLIMVIKTAPINQSTYGRHRFENVDSMIEKINSLKHNLTQITIMKPICNTKKIIGYYDLEKISKVFRWFLHLYLSTFPPYLL